MATEQEIAEQVQLAVANSQSANQVKLEVYKSEMELMRIAHLTLVENKRALPVSERGITAEEIVDFKNVLKSGITPLQL